MRTVAPVPSLSPNVRPLRNFGPIFAVSARSAGQASEPMILTSVGLLGAITGCSAVAASVAFTVADFCVCDGLAGPVLSSFAVGVRHSRCGLVIGDRQAGAAHHSGKEAQCE
jgi:hypothetical protein